jgi:hypothetical protein
MSGNEKEMIFQHLGNFKDMVLHQYTMDANDLGLILIALISSIFHCIGDSIWCRLVEY